MEKITHWLRGNKHKYSNSEELAERLRLRDDKAITHIISLTEGTIQKLARKNGLPMPVATDVLNDAIIILIEKISDKVYDPNLATPQTYLMGICKFLLLQQLKKASSASFISLELAEDLMQEYVEEEFQQKDIREVIEIWLAELGAPCNNLIRLRYLDNYSDQEQIDLKLTDYSSVNSLKVTRSKCMDKLVVIAEKWKKKYETF